MEYRRCVFLASLVLAYFAKSTSGTTSLVQIQGNELDSMHGMWCPIWRNLICGSDGVTYWNDCLFSKAAEVKEGLTVVNPGACADIECDECEEEELMLTGLEICGSNAQIFQSLCRFECYLDEYPLLSEVNEHCRRGFPDKNETESATVDVYQEIFNLYAAKFVDVIGQYNLQSVTIKKFTFQAEVEEQPITITCKRITIGDFSKVESFDPIQFYAYNDVYGRTKLSFQIPELEIRVNLFKVLGSGIKVKGRLKLEVGRNRFELIADTKGSEGEDFCPIIHAISLRLIEVDDVTVTLKPALPPKAAHLSVDGLIKDKLIELINTSVAPQIVEKITEIACLTRTELDIKSCFGFFQSKMCF